MRVIISAGGTGGHIYPALAIINKIKEMEPNSEFLYIGTHNRMEKDIVPKYNIPFKTIEIYGFSKNIFKNVRTVNAFIKSYGKCKKIIKDFNPDIVVGVGGYVTGPVIYAAHKLGYKTFIHEQNSVAGKANIFLSKYVDKIGISFDEAKEYFPFEKVVVTGNPCSENALKMEKIPKSTYGLSENKKTVLFVMGSLGASKVNDILMDAMPKFANKNYEVLFVTGKDYFDKVNRELFPVNVKTVPYIDNLAGLMKSIDVMVSRAGASTLSEILALNIPSILIPSPYVPNDHQYKNAVALVDKMAAVMIEERFLNPDILINTVDDLINDDKRQEMMKIELDKLAITDSSTIIYNEIEKLIKKG
ncbi:MAG: undecaprenyldiphospho-muramoylpentapeptide beta-N-acetylglucosaminyltransferase [Bacilli bacterium]|nr:undecaprenyldiphospho-muramoylpentapeptide beta-N-acetylglucosaminyltransferase [Bacilli bacterium]